jgi:hypothetical protein
MPHSCLKCRYCVDPQPLREFPDYGKHEGSISRMKKGIPALAVSLLVCGTGPAQGAAPDREWYTLSMDGQRVGYAWRETHAANGERIDSQVMRVYVSQMLHTSVVENTVETSRTSAGTPQWIRVQTRNGTNRSGWNATFASEMRTMLVTVEGTPGTRKLALPPDVLLPDQLPGALIRFATGTAPRMPLQMIDTSSASVAQVSAERVTDAAAPGMTSIRLTIPAAGNAPRIESFWLDAQSRITRRERPLFSQPLRWEPCSRDCNATVAKPYDVMARLIVTSPYRIPASALQGPIRYVISRADGLVPRMSGTSEQVVVMDGAKSIVTICNTCGEPVKLTDAERRSYLASNAWVQADSAEVKNFARNNGSGGKPERVMPDLVEAVRMHMTGETNVLGYASATQALATRSGDCTEFAVLLAAAARARGIPARLVVGLVYAERFSGKKEVFSPHMWVQAWTGDRWVSYDAGIGNFDATHIALAIGDGDPRRMDVNYGASGQWRIEKLGLVKLP